jgi:hypothetical protein
MRILPSALINLQKFVGNSPPEGVVFDIYGFMENGRLFFLTDILNQTGRRHIIDA